MGDHVRYDLTQVVRKCPEIVLEQPQISKILNGKYKEVIDEHIRENQNIEKFAMPPVPTSNEFVERERNDTSEDVAFISASSQFAEEPIHPEDE